MNFKQNSIDVEYQPFIGDVFETMVFYYRYIKNVQLSLIFSLCPLIFPADLFLQFFITVLNLFVYS